MLWNVTPSPARLAVTKTSSWVTSPKRMKFGLSTAELADHAAPLHDDQTVGARVLDRDRPARLDRQLAGAEELLAVDRAVDDPLVDVSGRLPPERTIGSR